MIQSFDSFEEMQEAMARAEAEANARVTDEQRAIEPGDTWIRAVPEMDLVVFGESWDLQEQERRERECGASDAEVRYTIESMTDSHARGYRYGMAYSTVEPRGEIGSTHIAVMLPLPRHAIEEARERDWDFRQCVLDGLRWAVNLYEGRSADA